MLAQHFHTAVAAARTGPELDELARGLWRAHAEGRLADADAQALSEAIECPQGRPRGQGGSSEISP